MVEAVLIRNDSYMAKAIEEYQRSELISFITFDGCRNGPQASNILTLKVDPGLVKDAPNESGTVIAIRTGRAKSIGNSETRFDALHQQVRSERAICEATS